MPSPVGYGAKEAAVRGVLLVNPNLMRPPVTPVGLDHIGQHLREGGFGVEVLDLAFAPSPEAAIDAALRHEWLLVAVTVRNVDDSFAASRDFCLARTKKLIDRMRAATGAPVVLGGVGFSIFARAALAFCEAPYAIRGEGEEPLLRLAQCLAEGKAPDGVPGLLALRDGRIVLDNPPLRHDLAAMPPWRRDVVDNPRYLAEGGQVGFETKRGCPRRCAYCADPVAKGARLVARTPAQVADELEALLRQGVDVFHTCDAEFNVPRAHALAVCEELARRRLNGSPRFLVEAESPLDGHRCGRGVSAPRGARRPRPRRPGTLASHLGDRIRWYAYAVPDAFDGELAAAMARAGCAGVDFTADHTDERMLATLGRSHTEADLRRAAAACHAHRIPFMFDLLLGGPGESRDSLRRCIEALKQMNPSRVGTSLGVRLYPGTPLVERLKAQGPLDANPSIAPFVVPPSGGLSDEELLLRPAYYIESSLGPDVHDYVRALIGGDKRFLFPSGGEGAANYNYNDNSALAEAIRLGARGAFWDILRRTAESAVGQLGEGIPALTHCLNPEGKEIQ